MKRLAFYVTRKQFGDVPILGLAGMGAALFSLWELRFRGKLG